MREGMTRRELLKAAGVGAAAMALPHWAAGAETPARRPCLPAGRPNFLFLLTDQQSLSAMSAAGNPWVKTPHMDRLAARGVRFTRSYCPYPLCGPARAALFTSRMPHEVGVNTNDNSRIPADTPTMGGLLRAAGYETGYAGKWHVPVVYPGYARAGTAQAAIPGFDVLPLPGKVARWPKGPTCGIEVDKAVAEASVAFLKAPRPKPFALVVSILNPHDICGLPNNAAEFARLVHPGDPLPPLPNNFNATDAEPEPLAKSRRNGWSDDKWRRYRGVYFRLVEAADAHVGRVMTALTAAGLADNTIVIFTSDHGEMNGSHRQTTKTKFYEESAAVPLIACVPGVTGKGSVDRTHLVSGLDILPTMCDYAGAAAPASLLGRSLRPLIEGRQAPWRDAVFAELVAGRTAARMVRTARHKYVVYAAGAGPEQLFDLDADPGETKNLAAAPDAAAEKLLAEHRALLKQWCARTNDAFPVPAASS